MQENYFDILKKFTITYARKLLHKQEMYYNIQDIYYNIYKK